ncbi:SpoIIE family protein phosphatase [Actinomycetospora sp. TBRC 11914]|uniref:SpoIIE family protein phosphatase n=1 Tax=Actinomycetospora sp. TBRC 11914 TaxID=2729387 RepID=UPI00145DDC9A|nr:SpoIIE family protein phosphatase [Actinomycetospora sp. TBRC 11914]NMO93814.1 SpoIIE family protein phosphatase [Actinomycetospora sp. TBRC 11914]
MDPLFADQAGVARDMAAVDWAATPLGPPSGWPTALRDVVRVVLTSRFAMWMAWGPELTMFYNDAYRAATLRRKHPWALGRPFDEVWAEIRETLTPQIRTVLEDGEATWDEDLLLYLERYGWPEETYHTFSYSPLYDGDRGVQGLLCVVAETTERVLAERRMAFLRDLASAMTSARSIGEVTAASREVLEGARRDLPFGLLYLLDPTVASRRARLVAAVGVEAGGPAAPAVVELGVPAQGWPAAAVNPTGRVLPLTDDAVPAAPPECDRVAVVPLTPATTSGDDDGPIGVLVVGLSRHLAYDERYRDFVELVAGQVTSGVLDARAAEADRERAEALADLDRTRRRFFADASHELRTPLTLVAGPVDDLLAEDTVDPARWRAELEVVARNTRRLARVVDDLLEVARLQAGEGERHREVVDVARLTTEIAGMVASAMERAGLEYVVDVAPGTVPVAVGRDGWERVVLNLVTNALKYTREGRVEVRLRREDERAVLTVADTGVGIPEHELPRLFDRFHRVEGAWARSAEGSGIGLALVHEITTRHGGDIEVASEFGVGTTFTVALPLAAAEPDASTENGEIGGHARALMDEASRWIPDDAADPSTVPTGPVAEGEPVGRVLVADDNADMRAYVTRLLAPRCTVTPVADGDAALASALADPPDMVVTDVVMPGRSGLDLLVALRADPRTARIPVLLLSARAGEEDAVEGLAAQADDYLVKPFSAAELQARVAAHLQLGRARREAEARFSAVADLAPVMIWVAGADEARLFLNAGWSRFTGLDPASELGHGWFEGVHPDDRPAYRAAAERGRATSQGWEVDYRLRHADGTYHRVVEQAVPVPAGGSGEGAEPATGWIGSCVDVHARLRDADRATLLAEIGEAMEASDTVPERLAELVRVLDRAKLGDRVRVLDPGAASDAEDGTHHLRRPLVVRGRTVGTLELDRDRSSEPWSADERMLADEVVTRVLPALENALLRTEERTAADRLVLVHRATAAFSAAATPLEVARIAVTHVEQLLGPDLRCGVYEYDDVTRRLSVLVRRPAERDALSTADVVAVDVDSILTRAVREEVSLWVHEPEPGEGPEAQDQTLVALLRARGLTKAITLPLIAAGRVVGALEVGFAGRGRLDDGERTTLQALAEPCGVALDRARLYRAEHQIAQTLQRSLLPQALPEVPRLPIAVRYQPGAVGTSAGGDWYDVVEVDDTHVAVVVGDVVGQGTAAAAVMGQLRTALSGYLLAGHGPGPALDLLDGLVARVPGARASTAVCLLVDIVTGEVRWARAGHLPALLAPADGAPPHLLTDPAGHGPLLGLAHARQRARTEGTTTIAPGTSVVLYTDGLVERRGESLDEGLDRLVEVATACEDRTPEAMASALLGGLVPAGALDDVAVVVVRLAPAPLEVRLAADPARLGPLRRSVAAWGDQAGLGADVLDDLQLALGEAATNAVEHAYGLVPPEGAGVDVRLTARADGGVGVCVRDHGAWREAPTDPGHRGRGLLLIRAVASDVVVQGGPDGTAVTFTVAPGRHEVAHADAGEAEQRAERPVRVVMESGPGGPVVRVSGDLDLAGSLEARRRLAPAEYDGPWTLDVTGVGYLASAGVGLLLEAVEHGAELVLPEEGPAARVLALSGLTAPSRLAGRSS